MIKYGEKIFTEIENMRELDLNDLISFGVDSIRSYCKNGTFKKWIKKIFIVIKTVDGNRKIAWIKHKTEDGNYYFFHSLKGLKDYLKTNGVKFVLDFKREVREYKKGCLRKSFDWSYTIKKIKQDG